MIFVILSSVTILVVDVKSKVPQWLNEYDLYFVTTVFIVEYLLRMWIHDDIHRIIIEHYEESLFFNRDLSLRKLFGNILKEKLRYITSPAAIIDLIAILPSYREIRILRVLVLFRVFKMLRYTESLSSFLYILKNKRVELITLLTLSAFFIFIAGVMLYVFEGSGANPDIHNLFDAFYWALVTISTVGYGDITPVTPEGRAVSMIIILTGIGLISFITSVIVASFSERLSTLKEDRVIQEFSKKDSITIVCGYGTLSKLVVKRLQEEEIDFVIIEYDPERALEAQNNGYHALCADATQSAVFERLGIQKHVDHVMALTADDEQNAFISITAKSLNPLIRVTARSHDTHIAERLRFAGIDKVVIPEEIAGMTGSIYARDSAALALSLLLIEEERGHIRIDEIPILPDSPLHNQPLGTINLEKLRLILLGIHRYEEGKETFYFNKDDDFILKSGDSLVCIGYAMAFSKILKKERYGL